MTFKYENKKIKQGYTYIIGCDEVGRGSLAGPVVAAAVMLQVPSYKVHKVIKYREVTDSKQLTPAKREELSAIIKEHALAWSIGEVSSKDIDTLNIHYASLLAMRRAVEKLLGVILRLSASEAEESQQSQQEILRSAQDDAIRGTYLFVDGKFLVPGLLISQQAVVEGDAKILSVATASIIAKVYRDNLMHNLHKKHPHYNFAQHKGYATKYHRQAILLHGLTPIHRLTFCDHLV